MRGLYFERERAQFRKSTTIILCAEVTAKLIYTTARNETAYTHMAYMLNISVLEKPTQNSQVDIICYIKN